ncbi:MAG: phenylalanine--tRNA ligase subunit beta [Saprospiraceae bacterium]
MQVSLNWLKSYLDLPYSPERIGEMLTALGLEVEGQEDWVSIQGKLEGIVVGKVLTCEKHPDADRLNVTTVDVGSEEPLQIVCGAPNVAADQHVVVATVGAMLYPTEGEPFKIKKGKIRGQLSLGMICGEDEIGVGPGKDGILVLDQPYPAGTPASQVFKVEEDIVFEIGLTPNRSDATSHRGCAADLWAYLNIHEGYDKPLRDGSSQDYAPSTAKGISVEVLDAERCPRYAGVVIEGLAVGESPAWLKNRLEAIGVRSVNNVVDATNYILHDLGQPLHAFDLDKMDNKGIRVGRLPQNTPFVTLDEAERKLDADDLMICDSKDQPLCIGGVFGGLGTGVTETTAKIFLESACFEPRGLRRSATRHDLRTDAAKTFEKGVDISRTVDSLKRAANLIAEVAGGTVASEITDILAEPIKPAEVNLSFENLAKLTGLVLPKGEVKKILLALNFTVKEENESYMLLQVPTDRADVLREADVVEEVLRVYGYDNVPLPKQIRLTPAVSPYPSAHQLRRRTAEYLIGRGFNEGMGLSLVPSKVYEALEPQLVEKLVRIHNTSTVELDAMRVNLIPTGLQAIAYNQNRQQLDLRFFESGKGYLRNEAGDPTEYEQLAIWVTGARHGEHWSGSASAKTSFSHVRGLAEGVLGSVGLNATSEASSEAHNAFAYAQDLLIGDDVAATFGRVSESYIQYFDTKSDEVYLALIHWPVLAKAAAAQKLIVKEISRFPQVRRDLAVVVDKSVTFGTIAELADRPAGPLAKSVELFDVYEDAERLGAGKRSYAIRFVFERLDRTLKDKEVDKAMAAVTKAIDAQPEMEVRR